MKKSNVKKLIMVVLAVLLLLVAVNVYAEEDSPIQINTATGGSNTTTNTASNTTTNTGSPITTTNKVSNTASSNYTNSTNLPKTGDASDYVIFAIIGVAIICAVYTFKRVKDYNIK